MTRKIFIITLLVTIILAGCNSQTPTEAAVATSTVTLEPTVTEAPVQATVAVELSPTATELPPGTPSTPETPRPTNEANCTNSAAFVTDVTIPDNTPIVARNSFHKDLARQQHRHLHLGIRLHAQLLFG